MTADKTDSGAPVLASDSAETPSPQRGTTSVTHRMLAPRPARAHVAPGALDNPIAEWLDTLSHQTDEQHAERRHR